ncbi:hypothetical protein SRHO_G00231600 [Serrasalmus rhombeus]
METIKNAMDVFSIALGKAPECLQEIKDNEMPLVPGDLLMRTMTPSKLYHAGIYCGKNEVIEFSGATGQKSSASSNMLMQTNTFGEVHKISVKHFANQQKLLVFRLKSGAPEQLAANIANAMDKEIPYDVMTFNCVHFALCILEIKEWRSTSRSQNRAVPRDPATGMLMRDLP